MLEKCSLAVRAFFVSIWAFTGLYAEVAINSISQFQVTTSEDIATAPTVTILGTEVGAVAACAGNSLVTSLTTVGGYTTPVVTSVNSYTGMWISCNEDGFMVSFIAPTVGYSTAAPYVTFSVDGNSWSEPVLVYNTSTAATPVVCNGFDAGFILTWWNQDDSNPYASFSSNQGATWTSPVQIDNSGTVDSAVLVAGTSGLLATWKNTSLSPYASFSDDNGQTWSDPVLIASVTNVASDVWVSGYESNFVAAWVNDLGQAYSSYSTDDGEHWSTPSLIAIDVLSGTDVSIVATSDGMFAAWIDGANQGFVAFATADTAWSEPFALTEEGAVSSADTDGARSFIALDAIYNLCLCAWKETDGNIYSNLAYALVPEAIEPPDSLTGLQKKNDFGFVCEYYNQLTWQASPSGSVAGYNVYRDDEKIATLGPGARSYQDHHRSQGVSTTYSVTAFDGDENESSTIEVTIP